MEKKNCQTAVFQRPHQLDRGGRDYCMELWRFSRVCAHLHIYASPLCMYSTGSQLFFTVHLLNTLASVEEAADEEDGKLKKELVVVDSS